jgi:hypothetical protein
MMTPLQDEQRSLGGATRAENQSEFDRKFLATMAASRRPLKNDVKMTDDELINEFRKLSKRGPGDGRPWIICVIVGADGRTIRSTLSDETIRERLKLVRGAIGFLGLTVFGSALKGNRAPSLQVYYRPLKKGTDVIETLDKVSREVMAFAVTKLKPIEAGAMETEARND